MWKVEENSARRTGGCGAVTSPLLALEPDPPPPSTPEEGQSSQFLTQVSHGAFFPPVTHLVSSALMCQERCLPPRVTQNVPTHVSRQALPQPYIRCKPCSIHASD